MKISVFVPQGFESQLLDALFQFMAPMANTGTVHSSRRHRSFMPLAGPSLLSARSGAEHVEEARRLEVLIPKVNRLCSVTALVPRTHTRNPPTIFIRCSTEAALRLGQGRQARPGKIAWGICWSLVKERLGGCRHVRLVGDRNSVVQKVAVCGGSGASLLTRQRARGRISL